MNRQEIERQQENLLLPDGPLYSRPSIIAQPDNLGILSEILHYDEEVIRWALGDFGLRLRDFASCVDQSHPEIFKVPLYHDNFAQKCAELLRLANYAKKEGMFLCLEGLAKLHTKNLPPSLRFLDTPYKNQQHVRLLPSRNARDSVRSTKSMREIDMRAFYKKGQVAWDSMPTDFGIFVRHNVAYKDELVKAEKKAERYSALGCKEMASKIEEAIQEFRSVMEDNYYGFHRITMTNAAVVLAKMHGYALVSPNNDFQILVPFECVKECLFDPDDTPKHYNYMPRAYPLGELNVHSQKIRDLVESLESFEDVNGKAIFDHYVVVVPGLEISEFDGSADTPIYRLLDRETGQTKDFNNRHEAYKTLDTTLIEEQAVTPILLGESDGKCYFICYIL